MKTNHANDTHPGAPGIDTLKITRIRQRDAGGAWVRGTIGGHRFDALVFPDHATFPEYELDDSRISKLTLQRGGCIVANFDRGWDLRPATPTAERIVGLLSAGLADHIDAVN
jgi:hypothetical protein